MSDTGSKIDLLSLDYAGLTAFMKTLSEPAFRAKQIWSWMYKFGYVDFVHMSNISKVTKEKLTNNAEISRLKINEELVSIDGTCKWLFALQDGNEIEVVFIPDKKRGTICISSQVGCTLNCKFCHTGTQPIVRNLTSAEIIAQILTVKDRLQDWGMSDEQMEYDNRPELLKSVTPKVFKECIWRVTNIVFMGMGEPLYNYDNVAQACLILMHEEGICISKRKITVSTSGITPFIKNLGEDTGVSLAISLHATNEDLRTQIMPINKKYSLKELLDTCREYPFSGHSASRRITFEYVMLKGVNDSPQHAKELFQILKGISAKVNLIPFNKWPGVDYECSSMQRIRDFSDILNKLGLSAPIRITRGSDIFAACGQLKSDSRRISSGKKALL